MLFVLIGAGPSLLMMLEKPTSAWGVFSRGFGLFLLAIVAGLVALQMGYVMQDGFARCRALSVLMPPTPKTAGADALERAGAAGHRQLQRPGLSAFHGVAAKAMNPPRRDRAQRSCAALRDRLISLPFCTVSTPRRAEIMDRASLVRLSWKRPVTPMPDIPSPFTTIVFAE